MLNTLKSTCTTLTNNSRQYTHWLHLPRVERHITQPEYQGQFKQKYLQYYKFKIIEGKLLTISLMKWFTL